MKLGPTLAALLTLMALTAGVAGAASGARGTSAVRTWRPNVTAPAQFDLTLAEVRFGGAAHVATSKLAGSVRLALRGPTGLDYVAGALARLRVHGRLRALVLVVNRRPRGSLAPDLQRIGLTVTSAARLGAPALAQTSNAFSRPAVGPLPALCDLPLGAGVTLGARDLRATVVRGLALKGFSAEGAVAEAYDVVCRRAYDPAFTQALGRGVPPACEGAQASIVACCPPNAMCVPPCGGCPCAPVPCPVPAIGARASVIVCPLASPPVACPL
jgi:hypothetical protein